MSPCEWRHSRERGIHCGVRHVDAVDDRGAAERDEARTDGAPVADDDDPLPGMLVRQVAQPATDPGVALGPRLATRKRGTKGSDAPVRGRAGTSRDLVVGQALGFTGVDLAPVAVGVGADLTERGPDDLRGLDRAREDARVDARSPRRAHPSHEPIAQAPDLAPAEVGEPGAGVVAREDPPTCAADSP